jgi:hypothetical protein
MNNRSIIFLTFFIYVVSNFAFAENCQKTVFRDGYIKQELKSQFSNEDLIILLSKHENNSANAEDYYMLGLSHRLGMYLKRDMNKSVLFYLKALDVLNTETNDDYFKKLYRNINYELGLLSLLCEPLITNKSALFYFTEAAKNKSHKEALYFKSIIELYSLGEISNDNKKIHANLNQFQSLLKDISNASSHNLALANFEMLYFSVQLSSPAQSIEKAKKRLFKTQFFKSCDYLLIQKNFLMPYKEEIDRRMKLIKELDSKYYQLCN